MFLCKLQLWIVGIHFDFNLSDQQTTIYKQRCETATITNILLIFNSCSIRRWTNPPWRDQHRSPRTGAGSATTLVQSAGFDQNIFVRDDTPSGYPVKKRFIITRSESKMATAKDVLVHQLQMGQMLIEQFTADLTQEEFFQIPAEGANHAGWVMGHLAVSEDSMANDLLGKHKKLPESIQNLARKKY